jgi:hypothetical protein
MNDYTKMSDEELNSAIYEKSGWTREEFHGDAYWVALSSSTAISWLEMKDFSGDISDAMELVEEMRPDFFRIMLMCWDHDDKWACQCDKRCGHGEFIPPVTGESTTLPRSICITYLMWKDTK